MVLQKWLMGLAVICVVVPGWAAGCGDGAVWPEGMKVSRAPQQIGPYSGVMVTAVKEDSGRVQWMMSLICADLPPGGQVSLSNQLAQEEQDARKKASDRGYQLTAKKPVGRKLGNLNGLEQELSWTGAGRTRQSIDRVALGKGRFYSFSVAAGSELSAVQRSAYEKTAASLVLQ